MTSLQHLTATTDGLPCRTTDPELWFSKSSKDRGRAIALCGECPIRRACAQHALDDRDLQGVWGGTTDADRRQFWTGQAHRLDERGRIRLVCGSERAYRAHFTYREQPCDECQVAHEAHVTAGRRARLAVEHQGGGSSAGFWIHRSLGEPPCGGCRDAYLTLRSVGRRERARRGRHPSAGAAESLASTEALYGPQAGTQPLALAG
jgi:hypothetical protein